MRYDVITCSTCQVKLRLPADLSAPVVTCPRCLRDITNPQEQIAGAAVAAPFASPAPSGSGNDWQLDRVSAADQQARHDARQTGCGLVILLLLVGAGIAVFMGWAINKRDFRSVDELILFGGSFALLLLLGVIGGLLTKSMAPSTDQRDQVVSGCMVIVMLILMGVALFVIFFISCAANFRF